MHDNEQYSIKFDFSEYKYDFKVSKNSDKLTYYINNKKLVLNFTFSGIKIDFEDKLSFVISSENTKMTLKNDEDQLYILYNSNEDKEKILIYNGNNNISENILYKENNGVYIFQNNINNVVFIDFYSKKAILDQSVLFDNNVSMLSQCTKLSKKDMHFFRCDIINSLNLKYKKAYLYIKNIDKLGRDDVYLKPVMSAWRSTEITYDNIPIIGDDIIKINKIDDGWLIFDITDVLSEFGFVIKNNTNRSILLPTCDNSEYPYIIKIIN